MQEPARTLARRLVAQATDRAAQKRLGVHLDDDPVLKAAVAALARTRGVALPAAADGWAGKRLLRLAQAREDEARVRRNPIRRDEAFRCMDCGTDVTRGGATVRDHCPSCLSSRHVDVVPGDRASACRGMLRATGLALVAGEPVLQYVCDGCGHRGQNRAHPDDDPVLLARLSAAEAP